MSPGYNTTPSDALPEARYKTEGILQNVEYGYLMMDSLSNTPALPQDSIHYFAPFHHPWLFRFCPVRAYHERVFAVFLSANRSNNADIKNKIAKTPCMPKISITELPGTDCWPVIIATILITIISIAMTDITTISLVGLN
ncbi:MAG: hypothetical protein EA359_08365 [Balneolaceae bacterium]|nr:MAG: hypothetical protein EA359_08365 [Balneolaceae bacterium]